MQRVSDADRANLTKLGMPVDQQRPMTFTRDLAAESRLLEPQVNMEVELNDVLKANQFSIKFVGLNTPSSLPPNLQKMPSTLFFTFKFYTFNAVQTEHVLLTTSKDIEESKASAQNEIQLAKKYHLVQED